MERAVAAVRDGGEDPVGEAPGEERADDEQHEADGGTARRMSSCSARSRSRNAATAKTPVGLSLEGTDMAR